MRIFKFKVHTSRLNIQTSRRGDDYKVLHRRYITPPGFKKRMRTFKVLELGVGVRIELFYQWCCLNKIGEVSSSL